MTAGEFWGSIAIVAAVLLLTLAFLWIAPPTPAEIEANRDTTAETKGDAR